MITAEQQLARVQALDGFGRHDDAIEEARRGLAEFPDDPELLGMLAWLEFFHGDRERSEQAARQAVSVRPDDWRGLTMLVENAIVRGAHDEAVETARHMLSLLPNWDGAHLTLAFALAEQPAGSRGERKQRRAEIRDRVAEAVALSPENVDTLRRGSILLARAGDESGSAELLSRALQIDPDNEELLMLVAGSTGTKPLEGLRILTGVLAANPQQRAAARSLSDSVWARTVFLASSLLFLLVGLLLFSTFVFDDGLTTTYRMRRQMVMPFLVLSAGWFFLLVRVNMTLPKGYLRKLYSRVWWVWSGMVVAWIAFLGSALVGLTLAVRAVQIEQQGAYLGGPSMMIGFVAWLVMIAEILLLTGWVFSERRNRLYPDDEEGIAAARGMVRQALWAVLIRGGIGILLALTPLLFGQWALRPEVAGAFPVVAIAVGLPPLVYLLLRCMLLVRGSASVLCAVAAGVLALAGIVGGWIFADRHAAEFDPPPTPLQLEMRERQKEMGEILDSIRETNEQLERALQ